MSTTTEITLPLAVATDAEPGQVQAVTAADASVALDPGLYKIAAMGQPLLWKVGDNAVTQATGSYLAAGDQEVIRIPGTPGTDTPSLRYIVAADSTGDGEINIVLTHFFKVTTTDPENTIIPE